MKHILAFEKHEDIAKYQDIILRFKKKLQGYQEILEKEYGLREMPKGIIWTNEELATTVFSQIPIPAFTNDHLIYMCPDVEAWRTILVRQLENKPLYEIEAFYRQFSEDQVFIILAHELTHHSDLFMDEFDDERTNSIWFEEGMCFYLPRKLLLDEREFNEITLVESELVEIFKDQYGQQSLEDFGIGSYQGSLASIMYDYWRSYLAVKNLVEVHGIQKVFHDYHQWYQKGRKMPLTHYFGIE